MGRLLARQRLVATIIAGAAAGCALQEPPSQADLRRDALPHTAVPAAWKAADAAAAAPLTDAWLASFDDAALTALVGEALAYNADLQVAAARVGQAQAMLQIASGSLLPAVGIPGTYSGKSGSGGGLNALFLNASLELDVWGRLRYGEAAAREQSVAVEADYAYARLSIAAMVTKSWYLAIEAGLQRALVDEALRAAQELHRVARERLRVGIGDAQAVAEAAANEGSFRDLRRQIVQSRDEALRALELLLGRYPSAEIAVAQRLAAMPPPVPAGLPSDLLERRPDVRQAQARLTAAAGNLRVAELARFPTFTLAPGIGLSRSEQPGFSSTTRIWTLAGSLQVPVFDQVRLAAEVKNYSAQAEQAVIAYEKAVQTAYGEAENSLVQLSADQRRVILLRDGEARARRAYDAGRKGYDLGLTDLSTLIQSEQGWRVARSAYTGAQVQALTRAVQAYKALGGGWSPSNPASETASR